MDSVCETRLKGVGGSGGVREVVKLNAVKLMSERIESRFLIEGVICKKDG
jgi:hypothetical protein